MDPIVLFLREDILPEDKLETDKIRRKASHFWLFEDENYTSILFLGRIYFAFTLKHQNYSLRNYMKGFVEAIQEANLYLTKPSLRAIMAKYAERSARICEEV